VVGALDMDLVLWRHGEAEDWVPGCDDSQRALTPRGLKQAGRMAAWLDRQLPDGARVLVSPALRAQQTATALGRKYKIKSELDSDANAAQLLSIAQWPDGKGTVLIVSHQPVLGQVIAQLLCLSTSDCAVKKGAVWWLRNRERESMAQTVVVTVQAPEIV
jgi:phosphohistidine phosphatase